LKTFNLTCCSESDNTIYTDTHIIFCDVARLNVTMFFYFHVTVDCSEVHLNRYNVLVVWRVWNTELVTLSFVMLLLRVTSFRQTKNVYVDMIGFRVITVSDNTHCVFFNAILENGVYKSSHTFDKVAS